MQEFIARQPIVDARKRIYGFELLFRQDRRNWCDSIRLKEKSSNLIVDSLSRGEIQQLTGDRRAFINCTRESLVQGHAALLPRERVVLEILETVRPDRLVMEACRGLKRAGYLIALDDFRGELQLPLADLADIIKIDYLATPARERRAIEQRFASQRFKLLAEKVETAEHFRESRERGYAYFQGYFFAPPQMLSRRAAGSGFATRRAGARATRPAISRCRKPRCQIPC